MQIEMIKPNELIEYENNPRDNEDSVEYVANSIKEFGFKIPILVDENNVIIAGHTRKKASLELGLETVPVIRVADLSDDQIKAFRLADNKVAEFSQWNDEMLNVEMELIGDSLEMQNFGFDNLEMLDIDQNYSEGFEDDEEAYESEEDDEAEEDEAPKERGYSITYEIAFANEEEQEQFYDYLGTLRREYPDADTISERILLALGAWASGR